MKEKFVKGRGGVWQRQPAGYDAFLPSPLPPMPPVEMSDALHAALSKADRALGRLDGSIATLPHPDLFLSMFVRREAALSSQIEGTQASISDVIQAEAGIVDRARPGDVLEVRNYVDALTKGTALLPSLPISTRLICELHRTLMRGVRGQHQQPGEIRSTQNWIGAAGCLLNDALFVPPPPAAVHDALSALERFIHADEPLPPLIKAGLVHAQFETLHPFLDGNGRIGRLLITLFLVDRGILSRPVLYLSLYLKRHRSEYYDRLQATRDRGDWEGWLRFFLEGVAMTANLAAETAKRVLRLREDDREKVIGGFPRSSSVALRVLDGLYELPVVTAAMIVERRDVSAPTANAIIQQFVSLGIVSEVTGRKRDRAYVHTTYQALFDDLLRNRAGNLPSSIGFVRRPRRTHPLHGHAGGKGRHAEASASVGVGHVRLGGGLGARPRRAGAGAAPVLTSRGRRLVFAARFRHMRRQRRAAWPLRARAA